VPSLYRVEFKKLTEKYAPLAAEIYRLLKAIAGLDLKRLSIPMLLWIETFETYTSQLYECETLSAIGEFVDWTTMDSNESDDLADKGW
jgi:hypothetical protein